MKVVGYTRVSTEDQTRTGYGLDDQRHAIDGEATRRGWSVMWIADEGRSGKDLDRPGLDRALDSLRRKGASGLVVAKLDRLTRSVSDFAALVERAHREGWELVVLDLGVDTSTPAGKLVAHMFAALAQWERETIGVRTRAALAAARARGVQLGRPRSITGEIRERIHRDAASGMSTRRIAAALTAEGVPTPQGGSRWWSSTISRVLKETG